jgi:hypothetical protein
VNQRLTVFTPHLGVMHLDLPAGICMNFMSPTCPTPPPPHVAIPAHSHRPLTHSTLPLAPLPRCPTHVLPIESC